MSETGDIPKHEVTPPLEQRAKEIASKVRAQGMGILDGKFCKAIFEPFDIGWKNILGFIQGENVVDVNYQRRNYQFGLISRKTLSHMSQLRPPDDEKQIWTISSYNPPGNIRTEKVKVGLFKKEKREVKEYKTYNGKHGEEGWVQYDLCTQTIYPQDPRPGVFVNMSIVVPPELSREIDGEVKKDETFPDQLFKQIYPGLVGPDPYQNITRKPANELCIVDLRGVPESMLKYKPQEIPVENRKFPQPIPY